MIRMLLSAPILAFLLFAAAQPPSGAVESVAADTTTQALSPVCPEPNAQELGTAERYLAVILAGSRPGDVQMLEKLGLADAPLLRHRLLESSRDAEACAAINELFPYMRNGNLYRVYFQVNNTWFLVPAQAFIGRRAVTGFPAVLPLLPETMGATLL